MRWGLVVLCWGVYEGRRVAFGWVTCRVVWFGSRAELLDSMPYTHPRTHSVLCRGRQS